MGYGDDELGLKLMVNFLKTVKDLLHILPVLHERGFARFGVGLELHLDAGLLLENADHLAGEGFIDAAVKGDDILLVGVLAPGQQPANQAG